MNGLKLVCCIPWILVLNHFAASDTNWNRFVTSKLYENTKLVLNYASPFKLQYMAKDKTKMTAQMECGKSCSLQNDCYSFNFYENETFYVCELLDDNFCTRKWRLALQANPGGLVWDKLNASSTKSCIEQRLGGISTVNYCETVSPGCNGTWPHCIDCVQSCNDCFVNRSYSKPGFYNCTLWPQGHFMVPIFSICNGRGTYIIIRHVEPTTGNSLRLLSMSLVDMNRLSNLKVYHTMDVYFNNSIRGYISSYFFSDIDVNGKLGNVSLKKGGDGFGLHGKIASFDFVNVYSDPDNCGSFWLLNPSNSVTCPGGNVSVFGSPTFSQNGQLLSTGIRWPPSSGQILPYVDIKLAP